MKESRKLAGQHAFDEKEEVVTIDYVGNRVAVGVAALGEAGGLVTTVGEILVVFAPFDEKAQVFGVVEGMDVPKQQVVLDDYRARTRRSRAKRRRSRSRH